MNNCNLFFICQLVFLLHSLIQYNVINIFMSTTFNITIDNVKGVAYHVKHCCRVRWDRAFRGGKAASDNYTCFKKETFFLISMNSLVLPCMVKHFDVLWAQFSIFQKFVWIVVKDCLILSSKYHIIKAKSFAKLYHGHLICGRQTTKGMMRGPSIIPLGTRKKNVVWNVNFIAPVNDCPGRT